ncbi:MULTISPECIES: lipopolysaccharide assembly protein LapA domain-containing protein [unclassified Streptomyces]|uniref:lipopolysaccharide assembly protein LapA domain-containing protein n=1 Tax=unclassified Streptomyces TaxID=2593676 RepID=UPI002966CD10|nr:lipopolysaccharide assembly protein LapA domain-containing protein [Streptomyces sp. SJL17-1]
MSPKEASRTAGGGRSRFTEALTPGRIGMAALAVVTLVLIFQNTGQVKIRLLIPEVSMPLYLALLATALIGAACGFYVAARRWK